MTSLTWLSRQARTQRVHWMQASRFTTMAGWLLSTGWVGRVVGSASGWSAGRKATPSRAAQAPSSPSAGVPGSCRASDVGSAPAVSASSSSSTRARLLTARSLWVFTSNPALATRQQLALKVRSPATSTTQARQLPSGRRPSLWHRWGMVWPKRWASCQMVSLGRASTGWPSSVSGTQACRASAFRRTFMRRSTAGESGAAGSAADSAPPGPDRRWTRRPSRCTGLAAWCGPSAAPA